MHVDGVEVFYRRVEGTGTPTVFAHGVPTHSEDWLPILERIRGPAIAYDLPGFGRSGRPAHGYTMHGYASFYERLLAALDIGRHKLGVHDWGVIALIAAQRAPNRIERLVVINAVPLLPGFHWHLIAQLWRLPMVGEALNKSWNRPAARLALRLARGDRRAWSPEFIDMIYDHLDAGTKRTILGLYRSGPPKALAAAGANLGLLGCPALVLWGNRDPYLPSRFGPAWAESLPGASLVELPRNGHWPWHEDAAVAERVAGFLAGPVGKK